MMVTSYQCEGLGCVKGMGAANTEALVYAGIGTAASVVALTVPVVGPIIAGVVMAAAAIAKAIGIGNGCGPTCVAATNVVNQAEPAFVDNVWNYENGMISQATAQANYQQLVAAVTQACQGIPSPGGTQCISDRFNPNASTWTQTANGDTLGLPGVPTVGQPWNWVTGYGNPLNYPPINASSVSSNPVSSVESLVGGMSMTDMLVAGGVIAAILVASS